MEIENIDVNSYPGSEKVYIDGKLHPIRVAMRRVNLTPTVKIIDGERRPARTALSMSMTPAVSTQTRT